MSSYLTVGLSNVYRVHKFISFNLQENLPYLKLTVILRLIAGNFLEERLSQKIINGKFLVNRFL